MELSIDFKSIISNLRINYLSNLIKTCEKNNIDKEILEDKLEEMKTPEVVSPKPIKKNTSCNTLTNTDSPTSNKFTDDYLYQKPWTKLTAIHKIIKMKEFINELNIENKKEKENLKEQMVDLIKTKLLTKKDAVIYDSVNGKIISIPILKYEKGKYII
jgi:hypothetical protein